jgi:CheY-like chemotaxis protein
MKNNAKILVVDDEAIIRDSLREWLNDAGYEVFTAENGPKALTWLCRGWTALS